MKAKTDTLGKELKSFVILSALVIFFLFSILALFINIYSNTTLPIYEYTLIVLISVIILLLLVIVPSAIAISFAFQNKCAGRYYLWLVKIGMDFLLPNIIFLSALLGFNKDAARTFYISINNILVRSGNRKYSPDSILLLIPHCAQDSKCIHRITNDIGNCKRCGRCTICKVAELAEKTGVCAAVVTGGSAALNMVSKKKPRLILASGCERELVSGMIEVRKVPVVGITNIRPNGPCNDTLIDLNILQETLEYFISPE